ncbi:signal transduction histidine kinase [Mangrovibacterium marinum]|uniref:histidine kinase n=1 Tax=Mangrovibacterium marinum TaxID=1639118 RepID=A0A2T5BYQ0_9BACT|nr:hybrid sensor histidine kinase/response regulator transcription factor [Mangrovibacterium marinum]PTN07358.1 signal transduction histidine kinase [Mangrovibacterium marinum]
MNRLFLSFLFAIVAIISPAQNEIHFAHLGMQDGFTNSRANTIIQDRKGFIWVGTWNGLNRYDGYNCINYQPGFHDSVSVANREIVALMEGKNGAIWIGTSVGLSRLDPETGVFKNYEFRNRILSLCEDPSGAIWIGTWGGGLYRLNPESGEKVHFLAADIVSDVMIDSRGILWVATYYGLLRKSAENDSFDRFIHQASGNSISNSVVTQITESADGCLWAGTWGGGLDRIRVLDEGQQLHFTNFSLSASGDGQPGGVVSKLYYDQFHNLWIGTWNDGLRLLRADQQQLAPTEARMIAYQAELENSASLSSASISALWVDASGLLWVGGATIDRASITERGVDRYRLPAESGQLPGNGPVRCFAGRGEQLFVASGNTVFQYRRHQKEYLFRKKYGSLGYPLAGGKVGASSVLDLAADSAGLWIGTEDAGLIFYPYNSDGLLDPAKAQYFNHQSRSPIAGDKVCSIVLSKAYPGTIWLGTLQSGITRLRKTGKGQFVSENFKAANGSLSDNNIRTLYEDAAGKLWIGTQDGLNCYDPQIEHFESYFYSVEDSNSLNDNVINAIFEDSSGGLWVGTNSGLNKALIASDGDEKSPVQFRGFPDKAYLSNEIVTNLFEDGSGNLWVRMYRGFIKMNMGNEEVVGQYFSRDYENLMLARNSSLQLATGQFVLDAQNGFLSFSPDSIVKNARPPKVVITSFKVLNQPVDENRELQKRMGILQSIPYTSQLELSYRDKMITAEFSAMDYKNPQKNEYQYKLEGFDNQWNQVGAQNTATYTNLPSGSYTLRVKAKNSDGQWSEQEAALVLLVSPPWWKSIWAYLVYLAAVGGLLYFFSKYTFIRAQVKSELKFEQMRNQEMARLNELKSFFFTDITHELKTPLTLILGPARELTADKSLNAYAAKQAELIKNSAYKLLRLVNQLMEFRKIEKGVDEKLYAQPCNVDQMLSEVYAFFKPMADSRRIHFSLNVDPESIVAYVDPDKLEKVIFNLISNAFKYSNDNSKIVVSARLRAPEGEVLQTLVLEVEDSGIGIPPEYLDKIFERFYQVHQRRTQSTGGIGLFLAKALVEQHGGTISVASEPGKGSCFRVEIPVNPELLANALQHETINSLPADAEEETAGESVSLSLSAKAAAGKQLILVIEDDADLNDFLATGLAADYRVITAFNGKEGLEKAREQLPDLILSDIMMPEMDGFEFCQIARQDINLSHIPLVFLTAKTMQDDEIKGLKLGAVDYIYKPFNLVSLKLKINNILSAQKQLQDRLRTEQILEPETEELSSLDEIFLKDAVEAIQQNLDDPNFDVEAFSQALKMSSNQLYRKIKALTGQTAKEFIRTQRLKTAAGLLVQKKRNISEIIYMVGFSSPSYFTRCFKEFYGCTPREYMEKGLPVDVGDKS